MSRECNLTENRLRPLFAAVGCLTQQQPSLRIQHGGDGGCMRHATPAPTHRQSKAQFSMDAGVSLSEGRLGEQNRNRLSSG